MATLVLDKCRPANTALCWLSITGCPRVEGRVAQLQKSNKLLSHHVPDAGSLQGSIMQTLQSPACLEQDLVGPSTLMLPVSVPCTRPHRRGPLERHPKAASRQLGTCAAATGRETRWTSNLLLPLPALQQRACSAAQLDVGTGRQQPRHSPAQLTIRGRPQTPPPAHLQSIKKVDATSSNQKVDSRATSGAPGVQND